MTAAAALFLLTGGAAAGLIGSLLGLGGGILIIPILVLILKTPMHNAIATSLLCVIATSSAAASQNIRSGVANVRLGMALEIATVLGALVGASIAGILSDRALMVIFACAILLMAIPMARGTDKVVPPPADEAEDARGFVASLDGEYRDASVGAVVHYRVRRLPAAFGVSSVAGVLSGLLGVGGGIIKVPSLTLFCGVPMKAAAATSNFMIGVTAVASAIVYYGRGEILPMISAASVLGVFAGSRFGARMAPRIHATMLRRVFAVVMVIIAAQFLLKARGISLW